MEDLHCIVHLILSSFFATPLSPNSRFAALVINFVPLCCSLTLSVFRCRLMSSLPSTAEADLSAVADERLAASARLHTPVRAQDAAEPCSAGALANEDCSAVHVVAFSEIDER